MRDDWDESYVLAPRVPACIALEVTCQAIRRGDKARDDFLNLQMYL